MIRKYDKLLAKLIKRKKMSKKDFFWYLQSIDNFYDNLELEYQLLLSNGMPLAEDEEHNIILKTAHTKIEDEVFCIVDIETNANTPKKGQIIEIGAVKVQNYEKRFFSVKICQSADPLKYSRNCADFDQTNSK
jgi:DNA polymerase-3 subunit epsilon